MGTGREGITAPADACKDAWALLLLISISIFFRFLLSFIFLGSHDNVDNTITQRKQLDEERWKRKERSSVEIERRI